MVHHCCSKQKVKRGLWSPEEDQKLVTHITAHGHGCWSSVPKLAGLERCGKSCRLRWINYLRPDVKRGSFTEQEETTIIDVHRMLGNRWAQIAKHLPGRTDNEVKNFWNSCIKKKLLSQGFDPTTHNLLLLSSSSSSSSSSPSHSTKKRTPPPTTKSNTFTVDHSTSSSAAAAVSIDHHTMKTMVMNNNMTINGNSRVDHIMMTTLNDDADDDLIINTSSTTLSALLKPREAVTTTASMFSSGCLTSTVLNDHHQYNCSNINWGSVSCIDHQLPFLDDQQSHHHQHHHTLQQQQQQISYGVNYNHHDDQLNMLFNSSGILDRHHQTEPDYQAQNINIKALIDGSSSITSDFDFEFVDPAFIMPPPPVYTTTTTNTCIDEQGLTWDC